MSSYSKTEDDIYDACTDHTGTKIKNSHEYLIGFVFKKLRDEKHERIELRDYNNAFNKLKVLRNESDYTETVINEGLSIEAKQHSDKIIKILNKNFKV